jgi:hypothetical protein
MRIVICMRRLNFFIPDNLDAGLKALEERDGVSLAESIRRALTVYLKEKGVLRDATSKGAKARK